MNKSTIWTIVGVIVAVVIAWFLVDIVFSLLWFIGKVVVVAIVAVIVFFVLRMLFARGDDSDVLTARAARPRTRRACTRAAARCTRSPRCASR